LKAVIVLSPFQATNLHSHIEADQIEFGESVQFFTSPTGRADQVIGASLLTALQLRMHLSAVHSLQQVLSNGASGAWNTTPGAIDGEFGAKTKASVQAFQSWGGGVVGDQTWAVSLHAASATLETAVGLQYAV
jgi:peptidoglycan hydrolase-like protein with peptidoglycan-binding domain